MSVLRGALFPLALVPALLLAPAHAAVWDLRPVQLRPGDLPPEFRFTSSAVYLHYTSEMKTRTSPGGTTGCTAPRSFRDGWREGLIEVYLRNGRGSGFVGLCGWLFQSTAQARRAFRADAAPMPAEAQRRLFQRIDRRRIGDESLAFTVRGRAAVLLGSLYILLFRHENAVVSLVYEGPSFGRAAFVQLGERLNNRLR